MPPPTNVLTDLDSNTVRTLLETACRTGNVRAMLALREQHPWVVETAVWERHSRKGTKKGRIVQRYATVTYANPHHHIRGLYPHGNVVRCEEPRRVVFAPRRLLLKPDRVVEVPTTIKAPLKNHFKGRGRWFYRLSETEDHAVFAIGKVEKREECLCEPHPPSEECASCRRTDYEKTITDCTYRRYHRCCRLRRCKDITQVVIPKAHAADPDNLVEPKHYEMRKDTMSLACKGPRLLPCYRSGTYTATVPCPKTMNVFIPSPSE